MRMVVPAHVVLPSFTATGFKKTWTSDGKTYRLPVIVDLADDIHINPWFYDTDGREINDCVHAKVVDESGKKQIVASTKTSNVIYPASGKLDKTRVTSNVEYYQRWWITKEYSPTLNQDVYYTYIMIGSGRYEGLIPGFYKINSTNGFNFAIWRLIAQMSGNKVRQSWNKATFTISRNGVICKSPTRYGMADNEVLSSDAAIPERYFDTPDDALKACFKVCEQWLTSALLRFEDLIQFGSASDQAQACDEALVPRDVDSKDFLFHEVDLIQSGLDPLMFRENNFWNYWRNWLIQHAYLDALQHAPTLNDNTISNIIELVGFIKGLVVDHRIEIPRRLQDAWLSYRYMYTTTKLDVEEAIKFMRRYYDLGTFNRNLGCYGVTSIEYEGITVTCRCNLDLEPKNLGYLDSIWRALDTFGLKPDFYVVWDMIPYSFIVDWLVPVGDLLSVLDAGSRFSEEQYTIKNVCFSFTYFKPIGDYKYKFYSRWASDPLPTLNEWYWFDRPGTSGKVLIYRIFDTVSLITGR